MIAAYPVSTRLSGAGVGKTASFMVCSAMVPIRFQFHPTLPMKTNSSSPFLGLCLFLSLGVGWQTIKAATKPNIIIILADDMGYADAGFTGAKDIRTPNLDRLAASGVIFTQGYANHPYCSPSRAALMSGRYQQRFGFESIPSYDPANPMLGIDSREKLIPARLREAGYVTGCIGKWHIGTGSAFLPSNRGFDYYYGFLGGGHDYFRIDLTKPVGEGYLQGLIRNDKPAIFDGYLTSALSRDAVGFVEANKDKPFFLYLAYNAPHTPLQAPAEAIARYADIPNERRRVYAAMVDEMDRGIGEVLGALDKNGLRENTLIFFLSDNGGPHNRSDVPGWWNGSSNAPFRAGKDYMYDGGVHVPFVASWPARLPAGITYTAPVISIDISRTAVEQAGANALSGQVMEGVDLVPLVRGEIKGPPHEALYWRDRNGASWAILAADGTKLVKERNTTRTELYFLPDDVAEAHDLMTAQPQKAEALRRQWETWNAGNVSWHWLNYIEYNKLRSQFYRQVIPQRAKDEGYAPEIDGND